MLNDLFLSNAWAQDAAVAAGAFNLGAMATSFLPIIFIFAIFYLLIIKPQNDAAKAQVLMIKALKRNDVVLIDGGLVGEVTKLMDELLHIKVNAEDDVCVARASVKKVLSAEEAKGWLPAAQPKKK